MRVFNPINPNFILDINAVRLKVLQLEIGSWDMLNIQDVLVTHGLDATKIRTVSGYVRNDSGGTRFALSNSSVDFPTTNFEIANITTSTVIALRRQNGGVFDSTNYNDSTINRGHIIIWFEA